MRLSSSEGLLRHQPRHAWGSGEHNEVRQLTGGFIEVGYVHATTKVDGSTQDVEREREVCLRERRFYSNFSTFTHFSGTCVCRCLFWWLNVLCKLTASHCHRVGNRLRSAVHSRLKEVRATAMVQRNTGNKKKGPPKSQYLPKTRGTPPKSVDPGKALTSGTTQRSSSDLRGSRRAEPSRSGRLKNAGRGFIR